jgi:hypothetical protein
MCGEAQKVAPAITSGGDDHAAVGDTLSMCRTDGRMSQLLYATRF